HWYSRSEQTYEAAEARLLSKMQYYGMEGKTTGTPGDSKTIVRIGLVDLDGDGVRKINTLVIDQIGNDFVIENGSIPSTETSSNDPFFSESVDNELGFTLISQTNLSVRSHTAAFNENSPAKNLVMCHGFGAGLGFFYRNYHALSQVPGWRIYSIDWLGMGRSSRPKFNVKGKTVDESVEETENFFIDSLEKWRQIHKIEKMTLLGHSLGGYLAAVYALKYPEHNNKINNLSVKAILGFYNKIMEKLELFKAKVLLFIILGLIYLQEFPLLLYLFKLSITYASNSKSKEEINTSNNAKKETRYYQV
ncbi:3453_t:CDS:1, partial [Entrophospora sp. SA101]